MNYFDNMTEILCNVTITEIAYTLDNAIYYELKQCTSEGDRIHLRVKILCHHSKEKKAISQLSNSDNINRLFPITKLA